MDAFALVGRYGDVIDAELARARLESAGIEAHLLDEATVTLDWRMTNAVGGIRLMVETGEAATARAILRGGPATDPAADVRDEPAVLTAKELLAERAATIVLCSCMLGLLLPYAAWLVARVAVTPGKLRPAVRRQFGLAAFLAVSALTLAGSVFLLVIGSAR